MLRQVTLSQAAHLARAGHYASAEELLNGLQATGQPDAAVLDMLARIRAQQGLLSEAESLWRKVQQLAPSHIGAAAALKRLRDMRRHPVWLQPAMALTVGLSVVLCLGIVLARQTRKQVEANSQLENSLVTMLKAEGDKARQQVGSLISEVHTLGMNQIEARAKLTELSDINPKLDEMTASQEAITSQLANIQAETKQLTGQQKSLEVIHHNQLESFHHALEASLAMVTEGHQRQTGELQMGIASLSTQLTMQSQVESNQVGALLAIVDQSNGLKVENMRQQAVIQKLQADYRILATSHEDFLDRLKQSLTPPALGVPATGTVSTNSGRTVIIKFEDGLFDRNTRFKPGAEDRLSSTVAALSKAKERLNIQVVGYSDNEQNVSRVKDSHLLGLRRAAAVVDFIRATGLFSAVQLQAASGDVSSMPFPSDTESNRMRNRTVVFHVGRASDPVFDHVSTATIPDSR